MATSASTAAAAAAAAAAARSVVAVAEAAVAAPAGTGAGATSGAAEVIGAAVELATACCYCMQPKELESMPLIMSLLLELYCCLAYDVKVSNLLQKTFHAPVSLSQCWFSVTQSICPGFL